MYLSPKRILRYASIAMLLTVAASAENLVIKGSNTLGTTLIPEWIDAFREQHPQATFELSARGSNTGFEALLHQGITIAASSRRARADEFSAAGARGVILHPTLICYDGISVIVHESNPLHNLTPAQIRDLFTGEINDWSEVGGPVGPIKRYIRNRDSGTYEDFQTLMLNRRRYSANSRNLPDSMAIVDRVSREPQSIGYVGLAFTQHPGIKVLSINGVKPSAKTIHDGTYPASRPNFFYTDGDPTGMSRQFIDFVLSEAGQQITDSVGFVPLKPPQ